MDYETTKVLDRSYENANGPGGLDPSRLQKTTINKEMLPQMTTQTQDSMKLVAVLPPAEQAAYYATARRACSLEAYKANAVAAEVERAIKERELTLKGEIASELGDDGKAKYSNAEKRDAEFASRATADAVLAAAREELDAIKLRAAAYTIDATYNADMVRILCAFAQGGNEVL